MLDFDFSKEFFSHNEFDQQVIQSVLNSIKDKESVDDEESVCDCSGFKGNAGLIKEKADKDEASVSKVQIMARTDSFLIIMLINQLYQRISLTKELLCKARRIIKKELFFNEFIRGLCFSVVFGENNKHLRDLLFYILPLNAALLLNLDKLIESIVSIYKPDFEERNAIRHSSLSNYFILQTNVHSHQYQKENVFVSEESLFFTTNQLKSIELCW